MNKKWLFLAIILLIIFAAILFSILYRAPTSKNLQTIKTTEEVEGGTITTTSYINSSGRPTIASDKGYATKRVTKNGDGHTFMKEYLDESDSPIALASGYAAVSYTLTDGLATTITYLDEFLSPVVISSGYDTIKRTYTDKKLADTDTYFIHTSDGKEAQVTRKEGYAGYSRIYNEKKQVIMLEYRGLDSNLVDITSGYARRIRSFNDQNKVCEERYYGADGSPAVLSLGQSGYTRLYDAEGRTIETTYLGTQGQPINITRGYSTVRTSYTESGTITQYYDVDGNPVTGGNSNYGVLDTGEQKIYLDEDGDVMRRLDNVLMTKPLLVLVIGTVLTILSLLLRGRVRIVFLVAYLLFIVYMTMYYREPSGSRNRLELFYSYRRILTNDSLRQQVLNNILLFIPLGTILSNLLSSRHTSGLSFLLTVLICMVISIGIEIVQYVAGIGLCEVDDVVSNTLGGAIGAAIAGYTVPGKFFKRPTGCESDAMGLKQKGRASV